MCCCRLGQQLRPLRHSWKHFREWLTWQPAQEANTCFLYSCLSAILPHRCRIFSTCIKIVNNILTSLRILKCKTSFLDGIHVCNWVRRCSFFVVLSLWRLKTFSVAYDQYKQQNLRHLTWYLPRVVFYCGFLYTANWWLFPTVCPPDGRCPLYH